MITGRKPCRRCLLEDIPSQAELVKSVRELIGLMPEENRAAAEVTGRRLEECRRCDHLIEGMCGLCGCYVELRAAKKKMRCPDVPGRWME